ncbi:MAG TPA: acyl-CoA synthetase [Acidimicrobiales bacterium]|nr:acyl-CoA synthetase [Acidimicrobiales bacterium]
MTAWNLADIFETVADVLPDAPAQRFGDRVYSWSEFDRRSDSVAADLLDAGLGHQSKVAAYLYNGPEYLESYYAAFKAGMAAVNVNYRYGPGEVAYLLDNADAEAVVFHASFAPVLEQIRGDLPKVKAWYVVEDDAEAPAWAKRYEDVAAKPAERVVAPWGRSPDDLLLLYTGGTTGMPKGVMWRHDDLVNVLGAGGNPFIGAPPAADVDEIRSRLQGGQAGMSSLPACPLMHGTGQFSAFIALIGGGSVVILPNRTFDPALLWRTVADAGVNAIAIVGDAFARPMLAELDASPGRYDLSKLLVINSSGVMWSQEVKEGLLRHIPHVILFDSLGSSEAVGLAASVSAAGASASTARFSLGVGVRVLTTEDRDVEPGSGEVGLIALPGFMPVGYYKDPEKSARTFRVVDGQRYSIPGDCATVDADGSIQLLGRGSVVINTGGEKVYPEEVEEVIKQLAEVTDAVCVGVPNERFGEAICAVVELNPGADVSDEQIRDAVRAKLAGYKVPRNVRFVDTIGRSPAGKVDYKRLREESAAEVAEVRG